MRGDYVYAQDGNLAVTVWQDTKPVVIISTQHRPTDKTTIKRKKLTGERVDVVCPQAVVDYNHHMGGVDLGDQYRQYYQVTRKFYKYIFWFMFEVCILNSFCLNHYSPCLSKKLSYLDYCVELAQQLIGNYNSRKKDGRPSTSTPRQNRLIDHYPTTVNIGKCTFCKIRRTVWYCECCDKRLCHTGEQKTDCHLNFHVTNGLL